MLLDCCLFGDKLIWAVLLRKVTVIILDSDECKCTEEVCDYRLVSDAISLGVGAPKHWHSQWLLFLQVDTPLEFEFVNIIDTEEIFPDSFDSFSVEVFELPKVLFIVLSALVQA